MKKSILALAVALAAPVLPGVAHADVAFNVGAVTDYRYRGISQTRLKPALQGGVDWSSNGWYLGTWLSTIKWIDDAGGDANVEVDVYGGYKGSISDSVGYDVGVLTYQYPGNDLNPSANTTEVYGALTFGMFTAKYSHSVTNLFGFADSKNSSYVDLSAALDMGNGWGLTPHVGYQKVRNNGDFSYWDYALTLTKDLGNGFVASAAVVGTDTDEYVAPNGKNLGKPGVVLGIKYNF
jgi:uncharacterized protein (TIGR02001 family)